MTKSRIWPLRHAAIASIAVCSGCQGPVQQAAPDQVVNAAIVGAIDTTAVTRSVTDARPQFNAISSQVADRLDPSFFAELESYAVTSQRSDIEAVIRLAISNSKNTLPVLPEFTAPLRHASDYDGFESMYLLRAPKDPAAADGLILVLGPMEKDLRELSYSGNRWILHVPSRPHLNYQLVGERDLWNTLSDVYTLVPETRDLPLYLVGGGTAADAALVLANTYASRLSGVAFSGGKLGLELPNLDCLPVVYFRSSLERNTTSTLSPWGRDHLIRRLGARGNVSASAITGSFLDAVETLARSPQLVVPPRYVCTDYQSSRVTSWMRVLAKKSESEPTVVETQISGGELIVNAPNASAIELDMSSTAKFPASIKRIRFNGDIFTFQPSSKRVVVGQEDLAASTVTKAHTPPGLLNFFRNEPVIVTYQDDDIDDTLFRQAQVFAERLASLDLTGLRPGSVQLSVMPLSEYLSTEHDVHRLIAIGKEPAMRPLLKGSEGYYPVKRSGGQTWARYRSLDLPGNNPIAYSLVYPPEREGALRLALLFVCEDSRGLSALSQHYLSATALYDSSDLQAWVLSDGRYQFGSRYQFDSFWGCADYSSNELTVPIQPRRAWEAFIREILLEETHSSMVVAPSLVDDTQNPPVDVSPAALLRYIPNRHYAGVRFTSATPTIVGERLVRARHGLQLLGLEGMTTAQGGLDVPRLARGANVILVDVKVLEALSPVERRTLDYYLLPYSLHEMVLQRFEADATQFGKGLLRSGSINY